MSRCIRIVVADDHYLFRVGLVELLDSVDGFTVCGNATVGGGAIALVESLQPDVVILDVEMSGPEPAAAVISRIAAARRDTRVVVLTMHDDPDLVRSLLDAGAAAYLLKSVGRSELVAAIDSALRGDSVVLAVSRATANMLGRGPYQTSNGMLSRRECEVLQLAAEANSNRQIARKLYISEATVKRHLANVYSKLGTTSRAKAVHAATAKGIVLDRVAGSLH